MYQVIVIGAGQSGLVAAYHLRRRGLEPGRDFLVLDANPAPGGAWLHRWPALTLGAAHHIHPLPGLPLNPGNDGLPASRVVSDYYAAFEERNQLKVRRPERVLQVHSKGGEEGPLMVRTDRAEYRSRVVINGTGTWDKPLWPSYPGLQRFRGTQIHTHDFRAAADFTGQRVLVVGGGTSAAQFLLHLHAAGVDTVWSTRRPPEFVQHPADAEWGREVERTAASRTRAGLPPTSVVSLTGIPDSADYRRGREAGVLVSRGPISKFDQSRVYFGDGSTEPIDAIIWATGFRAALDHLRPLKLREPGGGIVVDGVRVVREPRLFLVGYGASASTLGATRAGRQAAVAAVDALRDKEPRLMPSGV